MGNAMARLPIREPEVRNGEVKLQVCFGVLMLNRPKGSQDLRCTRRRVSNRVRRCQSMALWDEKSRVKPHKVGRS